MPGNRQGRKQPTLHNSSHKDCAWAWRGLGVALVMSLGFGLRIVRNVDQGDKQGDKPRPETGIVSSRVCVSCSLGLVCGLCCGVWLGAGSTNKYTQQAVMMRQQGISRAGNRQSTKSLHPVLCVGLGLGLRTVRNLWRGLGPEPRHQSSNRAL